MIRHRLNRTLTVLRPSRTPDGAGGTTETLIEDGTIRAQVSQPSAQEQMAAQQAGSRLTHVVHTTAKADVKRGDLLRESGAEPLRVTGVVQNSRRTYQRLECSVVQGE